MIPFFAAFVCFICFSVASFANDRESTDYHLEYEVDDAGGGTASSADYSETASAGVEGSPATGSGGVELLHGFAGGIYDIVTISLIASPNTIDEQGTRQIEANGVADDGSDVVGIEDISFSIEAGPLISVDHDGVALADVVFEDSTATVRGQFGLLSDDIDLTVLDTMSDNFGRYAGDVLPDDCECAHGK
jgi:hypothetical protein